MNSRSTYLTSPHALAVVLAVACASGAMATARTTPSQASDEDVIPWLPRRPHVEAPPPMAPPCRGADLRGTLTLQGGVGKLVGGAQLRNVGSRPCSLRGRPRLRFAGGSSTPTSWRVVAVRADPRDASLVYDRGSSLRALAP